MTSCESPTVWSAGISVADTYGGNVSDVFQRKCSSARKVHHESSSIRLALLAFKKLQVPSGSGIATDGSIRGGTCVRTGTVWP